LNSKKCSICESNDLQLISNKLRDSDLHTVVKCKKCSHIQLSPIPSTNDYVEFYNKITQGTNQNYFGTTKEYQKKNADDTVRRIDLLNKIVIKKGNILEIGSSHGFFLESAQNNGFSVTGIEISSAKRKLAKKITSATILNINLEKEIPKLKKFDCIVMFHVLEHIIDPVNFLNNIKKLLKKNGKLIIEVPNSDDFQLSFNKNYKKWYWQFAHVHYFNSKTIKKTLQRSNFKKIKIQGIQRYSIENLFYWHINKKPQLTNPVYNLENELEWLDKYYKNFLEKNLTSDTLVIIASN
jgi:2-polyprenyl-3-methyl-5-hydroxy-6-metoxy-1,4-benzoquinol methylase